MSDAVIPMRNVPWADAAFDVSVAIAKPVRAIAHLIDVMIVPTPRISRTRGVAVPRPSSHAPRVAKSVPYGCGVDSHGDPEVARRLFVQLGADCTLCRQIAAGNGTQASPDAKRAHGQRCGGG